jgi:hypothetical protein
LKSRSITQGYQLVTNIFWDDTIHHLGNKLRGHHLDPTVQSNQMTPTCPNWRPHASLLNDLARSRESTPPVATAPIQSTSHHCSSITYFAPTTPCSPPLHPRIRSRRPLLSSHVHPTIKQQRIWLEVEDNMNDLAKSRYIWLSKTLRMTEQTIWITDKITKNDWAL